MIVRLDSVSFPTLRARGSQGQAAGSGSKPLDHWLCGAAAKCGVIPSQKEGPQNAEGAPGDQDPETFLI